MNMQLLRSIMVGLSLLVAAIHPAVAQMNGRLMVKVPFEFNVGASAMPAGVYAVKSLNQGVIIVQNENNQKAAVVIGIVNQSAKPHDGGKLVFHRYGDRYFLSEVWADGTDSRLDLRKNRLEQELARTSSNPLVSVRLEAHSTPNSSR